MCEFHYFHEIKLVIFYIRKSKICNKNLGSNAKILCISLYKFARPVMDRLYDDIEFTEDYVNALAAHITHVSLAGMRAVPRLRMTTAGSGRAHQS